MLLLTGLVHLPFRQLDKRDRKVRRA